MLKKEYQLLLLVVLLFGAFYPAVLAGASRIDDSSLFTYLEQIRGWNLRAIFFPESSGGFYYRPVLALSFIFDKLVLGLYPGLMHLENVLLHVANAVLVYFLALQLVPPADRNGSLLPLAAALLFGLHPVNSESVNWISGRTDVLAGLFIFSSVLFLLKFREHHRNHYIILSLLAFLCAVLTKETALAFLPGAFLLIHADDEAGAPGLRKKASSPGDDVHATSTIVSIGAVVVVLIFFVFRSTAFTSNTSRIGLTIRCISDDWMQSMLVVLRAFGFYMKKLVVPYPLNVSIMEVDPLYEIVAVPLVAACLYITLRRTVVSAFFAAGIFLVLPAFILAFGQIAWTRYAERYLYIASAFIAIAAVVYTGTKLTSRNAKPAIAAFFAVLLVMFSTTLNRSMVWQDNLLIAKDTVEKSPWSRDMRVIYASLLIERGDYDHALEQLRQGKALSPPIGVYDDRFDMNLAYIDAKQGRTDEAIDRYELVLQKKNGKSIVGLKNLVLLLEIKKNEAKNESEKRALAKRILSYNLKLYELTHDPYLLYRLGGDAAQLDQYKTALMLYWKAHDSMSDKDPYKKFSLKRIDNLTRIMNREYAKNH